MGNAEDVKGAIEATGGQVVEAGVLPDGSGFLIGSFPLPEDHWLDAGHEDEPPAPLRCGTDGRLFGLDRDVWAAAIRAAARYAIRVSTDRGKIVDFDPDAMATNFEIGLVGYHTEDGHSHI